MDKADDGTISETLLSNSLQQSFHMYHVGRPFLQASDEVAQLFGRVRSMNNYTDAVFAPRNDRIRDWVRCIPTLLQIRSELYGMLCHDGKDGTRDIRGEV